MSESLDGVSVAITRQNAGVFAYGLVAAPRPRPAAAPRPATTGATKVPAATLCAVSTLACGSVSDARLSHVAATAGATIAPRTATTRVARRRMERDGFSRA